MHRPIFITKPEAPFKPRPEGPYTTGLKLDLIYYDNGLELLVMENYEGPVSINVPVGLADRVGKFLRQFLDTQVFVGHQVVKVNARMVRGDAPVSRAHVMDQEAEARAEEKAQQRHQASHETQGNGQMEGQQTIPVPGEQPTTTMPTG